MPGRPSIQSPTGGKISKKNGYQKEISKVNSEHQEYVNPPAGVRDPNLAAARDDVTAPLTAASCSATIANPASLSWGDSEMAEMGTNDGYTTVRTKKRRRDSPVLPAIAAQSNSAGASRRQRPSTGRMPQGSPGVLHRGAVLYLEYCPEYQTYQYMKAMEKVVGGTRNIVQFTKVNGQYLVGLANRSLAERLVREGLEIDGTLLKTFPFRRNSIRITIGNLPFFVGDAAVMDALSRYGRITSIAPKELRVGEFNFTDGRREAFILLHDGITVEMLPSRFELRIKGEPWPAFLTHGIKCSKCRGQGHRRANCPQLQGRPTTSRRASPPPSTSLPPSTAPGLTRRTSAAPPAPAPPSPAMEVCGAPPVTRAVLHPSAPRPYPPAAPALPMEETPSAPPPVTPAPPLQAPEGPEGPRPANSQHPEPPPARPDFVAPRDPLPAQKTLEPAAPTPDVEMSIVDVSFAGTDALGLGREEVLDLLSSRTKAQRNGPLLSPPQCDALAGLIRQILDLRPGAASNLYKVLGQVKAELRTTPAAVPPTPPLPAPRPAEPMPPTTHREELTPPSMTPPLPAPTDMEEDDPMTEEALSAPRLAEPKPPALHMSTHVYLGQVKAELRTTPAVPLTPPLPAPRPSGPTPPTSHSEVLMPAVMTPPPPALTEMEEDNPITEKERCAPPPPAPRLAEPTPPAPHGEEVTPAMTTPPPPLPFLLQVELESKCERQTRDLLEELNFQRALRPLIRKGLDLQGLSTAIMWLETRMQILPRRSTSLAAIPTANAAAQVRRNWAGITEEVNPGAEEGFTLVQGRKRRRGSANSPTAAAPSSNAGGSRTIRRPQPSAGSVPRAHPELEPFHYLKALDRMLGGTAGVIQITKVNGHQLLGLTNRGLAERLISEGLEVEGTLLRAFPFRKRAERITVGNLPFFVGDSAVINALSPYGRVTSIAPKQMKAGPYVYVDGRRDIFITLHEGITIERLPTRLDINIKGEAWPAYLSSGIRCSRCHGQGHRRAICPPLAGLANNTRMAPPTTPAGVPPPTTPAPPQRSAAQPPAPAPSNPAMEVCSAPPVARAVLYPSAPRPYPPAAPALPMEETPSAPPPVTLAPSLQVPEGPVGPRPAISQNPEPPPARPDFVAPRDPLPAQKILGPAAPTPDVEMSIVEETSASSTSSAKNATRVDLDAFIEKHPSVSFAGTDLLGLGREEVLDLLSSRTKAQRKGPLLSPPQCDALAGLIGQILYLRPGAASNLYKVLGQVKAELRTTPTAVSPTPPLPAPRPAEPTPPAPHGKMTTPAMATSPSPLFQVEEDLTSKRWDEAVDIIYKLSNERYSGPMTDLGITEGDITDAVIYPEDREPLLRTCSTQKKNLITEIISAAIERARDSDPSLATAFTVSTPHVYTRPCGHASRELLRKVSRMATNLIRAESPSNAEQKPVRHGAKAQQCAELSKKEYFQKKTSNIFNKNQNYANPPAGGHHANPATPTDFVTASFSEAAAQANRSWADSAEDNNHESEDPFITVQRKKRRRGSAESPAAAAPSSNIRGAGAIRRPRSSTGWAPRAEEVWTTRAHIAEARARQASSTEDHSVYVERSPELEPYHYMKAMDRMFGSTREVFQVTKMNGHFLVGLANRGMAERLVNEGLEVEGTLHRAFPFRKRAERITVGNLPFFVGDAAFISALTYTSIAPKLMKAGPYIYNDGRREAYIILREGLTIERLPTRPPRHLNQGRGLARIPVSPGLGVPGAVAKDIAGPTAPCSQGEPPTWTGHTHLSHQRPTSDCAQAASAAICPASTSGAPEGIVGPRPAGSQHPEPPPARPEFVAPRDPLPAQKTLGPAAPTPDVEMSIVEETSASSTSAAKNATRIDLDEFIERHPSVSFAGTDALGLGREEVLDLLSSRTKAQRNGPLLSPPQGDALAGLIKQILDLRPGAGNNIYKNTPAAPPPAEMEEDVPMTEEERCAPPPPAPRLAGPIPPVPHGDTTTPAMATPPPPLSTQMDRALMDKRWEALRDLIHGLNREFELDLEHRFQSRVDVDDIIRAILYPGDREPLIKHLPTRDRYILGGFMSTAIRRARELDHFVLESMSALRKLLPA
ncbi:hypothetical protein LAZ67_8002415 [Cordylochernes scorpioides]|uniref:CCHC-type domain-containing protein n=1 Tax=Cordylochernes scorpioides TaxID=51811 RepID=A0ABY6KSG0_9ARAC|nr:hypothetical protein LAZ67_8002415 [Cordylochernes scorpioides]